MGFNGNWKKFSRRILALGLALVMSGGMLGLSALPVTAQMMDLQMTESQTTEPQETDTQVEEMQETDMSANERENGTNLHPEDLEEEYVDTESFPGSQVMLSGENNSTPVESGEHVHHWTYMASGYTNFIGVICDDTDGMCPYNSAQITIYGSNSSYNGQEREIRAELLIIEKGSTKVTYIDDPQTIGITLSDIVYQKDGTVIAGKPIDSGEYWGYMTINGARARAQILINKVTPVVKQQVVPTAITYGETLNDSEIRNGGMQYSETDSTEVTGTFTWKEGNVRPTVADSQTTEYTILFTPTDQTNYESVELKSTLTVMKAQNAPNIPGTVRNVSNSVTKVGDVKLPTDWEWVSSDKESELEVGVEKTATAEYTGADKGNYVNECVTVKITRSECEHVEGDVLYTERGEHEPTCTVDGLGHRECIKCHQMIESGVVVKAAHKFSSEWTIDVEPTATMEGSKSHHCTVCDAKTDITVIPKCEHVAGDVLYTGKGEHAPTCTVDGLGHRECIKCHQVIESGVVVKAAHKFSSEWTIDVEPTATMEGSKSHHCTVCDAKTDITVIPKCEHVAGDVLYTGKGEHAPTCTVDGLGHRECIKCHQVIESGVVVKAAHKFSSEWTIDVEPTATMEGSKSHHCTVCDAKTDITVIPKCEHVAGDVLYTGKGEHAPTCTVDGLGHRECIKCHQVIESGVVVKAAHKFSSEWTIDVEPTATMEGSKSHHCTVCDAKTDITVIPKCEHVAGDVLYTGKGEHAPTCTVDGLGHRECIKCHQVIESGVVVKAAHKFSSEWTIDVEPTMAMEGIKSRHCTVCDAKTDITVIPRVAAPSGGTGGNGGNGGNGGGSSAGAANTATNNAQNTKETGTGVANIVTPLATSIPATETMVSLPERKSATPARKPSNRGTAVAESADDGNLAQPFLQNKDGKKGWKAITSELAETEAGTTLVVDMNGVSVVPGDVFEEIRGKDITIEFDLGNGIAWKVNGQSVQAGNVGDIDFAVKFGEDANNTIPVDVINHITGERMSMNLSLAHDGSFGFEAVLTVNIGSDNAGLFANLFYYNEGTGELEFICAGKTGEDGSVELTFNHASEYIIVVDAQSMEQEGAETALEDDTSNPDADVTDGTDQSVTSTTVNDTTTSYAWLILLAVVIAIAAGGIVFVIKRRKK